MEDTKKLRTICNIILLVLGLMAGIACFVFAIGDSANQGPLDFSFFMLYVLLGLSIATILFFLITQVIADRKQLIRFGLLIALAVVIILVAYLPASSELSEKAIQLEVGKGMYKWIGGVLNMVYILLGGVIAAFFGTIIYSKLKK